MAANYGTLTKPQARARIAALVLEGKSDAQIGIALGVTRQAITGFRHRHAAELIAPEQAVAAAIVDVARKEKEQRIRHYDAMINRIEALIEARGTGLEAVDYKSLGQRVEELDGVKFIVANVKEVRRFDAALVREWRGLHRDIAEELGQIPQAAANITLNDNRTYVRETHTTNQVRLG